MSARCERASVLIVDDDPDIGPTIEDCLAVEGYTAEYRQDAREALDYLQDSPPPCLVLLDLYMPVMTGEEFRRALLERPDLAGIPVVIISAARDGRSSVAPLDSQPVVAWSFGRLSFEGEPMVDAEHVIVHGRDAGGRDDRRLSPFGLRAG